MISFKDVSKHYGLNTIFEHATFDIAPGECVAITGDSGVGKSTLIHLLIGAETISSGSIEIDNFSLERLSRHDLQLFRRNIGVVFQDFKLLKSKTVYENVAFALEVIGASDEEVYINTMEVLKKVGLQGKEHNFPAEISGGEKQRAAIARALVHNPKLIIADEPTGNLDFNNSKAIVNLLQMINKEGVTLIVATHDDDVLNWLKPRIIRIADRKVYAEKHQKHQKVNSHCIDLNNIAR